MNYVAFKETQELAFYAAFLRNFAKGAIATQASDWHVLRLAFSPEEALALFQSGRFIRYIGFGGWRLYGDFEFKAFQHEWVKVKIGPLGLSAWSDKVLTKRYQVKMAGHCNACQAAGVTWEGGKAYRSEEQGCGMF